MRIIQDGVETVVVNARDYTERQLEEIRKGDRWSILVVDEPMDLDPGGLDTESGEAANPLSPGKTDG